METKYFALFIEGSYKSTGFSDKRQKELTRDRIKTIKIIKAERNN